MKPENDLIVRSEPDGYQPFVGPYPILNPSKFFGREREVQHLCDMLLSYRIVLLHSPSGAGKTSLINAGLIPRITDRYLALPPMRVHRPLPPDLAGGSGKALNRYTLSALISLEDEKRQIEGLPPVLGLPVEKLAKLSLSTYLERRLKPLHPKTVASEGSPLRPTTPRRSRILLIFDQFEEILTLDPTDRKEKNAFFRGLSPLIENYNMWMLFVMRDDHIGSLEPYLHYFPDELGARFHLELLERDPALEAIQKPVENQIVRFHKTVAKRLVDDLRQVRVIEQGKETTKLGLFVEPFLLQVACLSLWDRFGSKDRSITVNDYQQWGPVDEAIRGYYNQKVGEVAQASGVRERNLRNWMEYQLISERGLRITVEAGREMEFQISDAAVMGLINAYLLRKYEENPLARYELAHDRLIRPVIDANSKWREGLQPFQREADRWIRSGTPEEQLLRGRDLQAADTWAAANPRELSDVDQDYLKRSRETSARGRRGWLATDEKERQRMQQRAERGTNLEETGWGVILPPDKAANDAISQGLRELLDHRRAEAGQINPDYFHVYTYSPGQTAQEFLSSLGTGSGPVPPQVAPGYLLIAAGPEIIPFEFQMDLDRQFSVGRVAFDTIEEYARYARTVVSSEGARWNLPRRTAFFTPHMSGDQATRTVRESLIIPMLRSAAQSNTGWRIDDFGVEGDAKTNLHSLLSAADGPSLLFFAGHGIPYQSTETSPLWGSEGALVLQKPVLPDSANSDWLFTHNDVNPDHRLAGMIFFLLSGWTAGALAQNPFRFLSNQKNQERPTDYTARLAKLPGRLLGHEKGGALVVIGHLEELWLGAMIDQGSGENSGNEQQAAAESLSMRGILSEVLNRLMQGYTAGAAMEPLNRRAIQLQEQLNQILQGMYFYNRSVDHKTLSALMLRLQDARSYLVLGDPAARLPVELEPAADPGMPGRPTIIEVTVRGLIPKPQAATTPTARGQELVLSGVDAVTGQYAFPGLTVETLVNAILADPERMGVGKKRQTGQAKAKGKR